MLRQAVQAAVRTRVSVPLVQADAGALPFADESFDIACSAFGAVPFVAGSAGLVAQTPYFDRTPYVEVDGSGAATYVEHHRTLGDRVREIVGAGLRLRDIIEPPWPAEDEHVWGQWSPLRGRLVPGTAIFVCDKPG